MRKKKIVAALVLLAFVVVSNICVVMYQPGIEDEQIKVEVIMEAEQELQPTLFYLTKEQELQQDFSAQQSSTGKYTKTGKKQKIDFLVPAFSTYLRLDPCENGEPVEVYSIKVLYNGKPIEISEFNLSNAIKINDSEHIKEDKSAIRFSEGSMDPGVIWKIPYEKIVSTVSDAVWPKHIAMKAFVCLIIDIICLLAWKHKKMIWEVPREIIRERKLIFSLSKNDFKTRFAGSYFGIIWAFVQPIVTVLVYWFVFEKALSAGAQTTKAGITVPFVLWLIAGIVPWFFFSEVLAMGTNALIEYSYLVKKVVFKISILPIVKIVSSLYVHLAFLGFTLILYICYGYFPGIYVVQIAYYSFCMIALCLGIVYATSAIVVFFRDLSQVINILLQVGMWVTPIMWNMDAMIGRVSPVILGLLKLNPMYYIVSGYRDTLINHIWFWERPEITLYFWIFVSIVFGVGFSIFRKLQIHFADVL